MEERPVLIVGSGPGGSSTALSLAQLDPALAGEALLLEKARHPREKVCAGGLIPHTLSCLERLGVELTIPHVVVDHAAVRTPGHEVLYEGHDLCRVIRRTEFDALLVDTARSRGVEIREAEKVIEIRRESGWVRVETEKACYRSRIVIGADGSGSLVRRRLVSAARENIGRAVMCDVPLAQAQWSGFVSRRYDFSFQQVASGLRGYTWAFPCWVDGEPHVNVGAYAVDPSGPALLDWLGRALRELTDSHHRFQAFPIHWYRPGARIAAPGVVLVGDAAGVDPLMGEGISFAFEYGRYAAEAVIRAHRDRGDAFDWYERTVRGSWLGKKLRRLHLATRLFYGPTWRLWFGIAARSRRARELGLRWYNGVDGWDQRSGWQALRALSSGDFAGPEGAHQAAAARPGPP